jgi:hypothetical protein
MHSVQPFVYGEPRCEHRHLKWDRLRLIKEAVVEPSMVQILMKQHGNLSTFQRATDQKIRLKCSGT